MFFGLIRRNLFSFFYWKWTYIKLLVFTRSFPGRRPGSLRQSLSRGMSRDSGQASHPLSSSQKFSKKKASHFHKKLSGWKTCSLRIGFASLRTGFSPSIFFSTKFMKQKKLLVFTRSFPGGRPGSNRRPLEPQSSALTS